MASSRPINIVILLSSIQSRTASPNRSLTSKKHKAAPHVMENVVSVILITNAIKKLYFFDKIKPANIQVSGNGKETEAKATITKNKHDNRIFMSQFEVCSAIPSKNLIAYLFVNESNRINSKKPETKTINITRTNARRYVLENGDAINVNTVSLKLWRVCFH